MVGTKIKQVHSWYSESLCPFLFQTRTIQSANLQSVRKLHYQHQPSRKAVKLPTSTDTVEHIRNSKPIFRKAQPAQHVDALVTSTITAEERRIFEKIKRRFGGTVEGITATSSRTSEPTPRPDRVLTSFGKEELYDLHIDNILSLFAPVSGPETEAFGQNPQSEAQDGETTSYIPVPSSRIRAAALMSLQHIAESLRLNLRSVRLPPDFALWSVLEDEIFPLVTVLQSQVLHQYSPSQVVRRYQFSKPTTIANLKSLPDIPQPPSMLNNIDQDIPLLPFVTILYPAATLLTLRTYAACLPTSGFAVALLPKIKSLGPTSFILAGNAHFFNCLIQIYWDIYSDLHTISALLKDMHENGLDFNSLTLQCLETIINERDAALKAQREHEMNGNGGGSSISNSINNGRHVAWWKMAHQQKPLEQIEKHWIPVIRQELNKPKPHTNEIDEIDS